MSLSIGQRQELRQKIEQTLEQRLSMEIRQTLEQLLKLIMKLEQSQMLRLEDFQRLGARVSNLSDDGYRFFVNRLADDGSRNARELADAFRIAASADGSLQSLDRLGTHLRNRVSFIEERIQDDRRLGLGLRMVLRQDLRFKQRQFLKGPVPGGIVGTPDALAHLLETYPQSDEQGMLRWILAGGWAVELLTGESIREHHDIDTLLLTRRPRFLDTDVINTDDYFGVISCTDAFVIKHCRQSATWKHQDRDFYITVLRPEFLFCSKFLKRPREKDWDDVKLLVTHFAKTWNLLLIGRLADRNMCCFKRRRELLEILRTREPAAIIRKLKVFYGPR